MVMRPLRKKNEQGFALLTILIVIAALVPILILGTRNKASEATLSHGDARQEIAALELVDVVAQHIQRSYQRARSGLCGESGAGGGSWGGVSEGGALTGLCSSNLHECFSHPLFPEQRVCIGEQIRISRYEPPASKEWFVNGTWPWFQLPQAQADVLFNWATRSEVVAAPTTAISWAPPSIPACGTPGMYCFTVRICMKTNGCSDREYINQQIGIMN